MTLKPNNPASKDPGDQSIALKINHKGLPLALINATVAVSLGTLFLAWSGSEMAGGLGLIFPTADLYPLERAATIPFTFCFVYGLWMSHCNGGKIWIAVLSILSLFSLLFYEWYRAHIDFNHLDPDLFVSVFSGCAGAFIGYKAFKLLRRRCTVRTSLWVTQAYLLAFPFVLFLLHVAKLPHNLLTYLLVGLGFGIASGLTGGGRSFVVASSMTLIAILLPSLAGLSVMCLYTKHGFWTHIGCIAVVTTAISYNITFSLIGMLASHLVKRAWLPPDGTASSPSEKSLIANLKARILPGKKDSKERGHDRIGEPAC